MTETVRIASAVLLWAGAPDKLSGHLVHGLRSELRPAAMRYAVVVEPTATGYSAYSPDLPGCIATGPTRRQVRANMREAIAFHVEGLRLEGFPVPPPQRRRRR